MVIVRKEISGGKSTINADDIMLNIMQSKNELRKYHQYEKWKVIISSLKQNQQANSDGVTSSLLPNFIMMVMSFVHQPSHIEYIGSKNFGI